MHTNNSIVACWIKKLYKNTLVQSLEYNYLNESEFSKILSIFIYFFDKYLYFFFFSIVFIKYTSGRVFIWDTLIIYIPQRRI